MSDDKYITFKSEDFYTLLDRDSIGDASFYEKLKSIALADAVIIRRQDLFASPCLATYASMISLVASREADPDVRVDLMRVADYFEDQAKLAADEGYKLPTI
jgi:hypothetical protein